MNGNLLERFHHRGRDCAQLGVSDQDAKEMAAGAQRPAIHQVRQAKFATCGKVSRHGFRLGFSSLSASGAVANL